MTARLSESAASRHPARVLSVSPMTVRALSSDNNAITPVSPAEDQQRVRSLSHQANAVINSLHSALDQASMGDAMARDTVRSLQERLRVGARMLQAFQAQITRIEAGIAELQQQCEVTERAVQVDAERLDDQAAAFEQRLEVALDHFERRLTQLMPRP